MISLTPKGYCLADITIEDPAAYQQYMSRSGPAVAEAGGRFLIRGGSPEVVEGSRTIERLVLVEFGSPEGANAFYSGARYQEALPYRKRAATCHYALLTGNDIAIGGTAESGGPKGYLYAEIHPTDLIKYMEYPKLSTPIVERFNGRFLVRGGEPKLLEGAWPTGRVVIVEFPSVNTAREFYHSAEYQNAMQWRLKYAKSHICLLEGV